MSKLATKHVEYRHVVEGSVPPVPWGPSHFMWLCKDCANRLSHDPRRLIVRSIVPKIEKKTDMTRWPRCENKGCRENKNEKTPVAE